MPNRYEREIEEILRNLESTEPKQSIGQKFGERLRRKPNYRVKPPRRTAPSLKFGVAEWLIVTAVIAALIAGGYAYAHDGQATLVTGILAIIGTICLLLLALSHFIFRSPRSSQASRKNQRTTASCTPSVRWDRVAGSAFDPTPTVARLQRR